MATAPSRLHPTPHAAPLRLAPHPEDTDVENAESRILAAIEKVDAKVDGVLQHQAAQTEWRKVVDEDRHAHEARLDDLEEALTDQRISLVKITAWAAGVAAAVSAFATLVGLLMKVR